MYVHTGVYTDTYTVHKAQANTETHTAYPPHTHAHTLTAAVHNLTDHSGDCHADIGHSVHVHCKELGKTLLPEQLHADAFSQQKLLTQIDEPAEMIKITYTI